MRIRDLKLWMSKENRFFFSPAGMHSHIFVSHSLPFTRSPLLSHFLFTSDSFHSPDEQLCTVFPSFWHFGVSESSFFLHATDWRVDKNVNAPHERTNDSFVCDFSYTTLLYWVPSPYSKKVQINFAFGFWCSKTTVGILFQGTKPFRGAAWSYRTREVSCTPLTEWCCWKKRVQETR